MKVELTGRRRRLAKKQGKGRKKAFSGLGTKKTGRMKLSEALSLGVAHQRAGKLSEAKAIYQRIIEAHPNSVNAIQLLGTVFLKEGDAVIREEVVA